MVRVLRACATAALLAVFAASDAYSVPRTVSRPRPVKNASHAKSASSASKPSKRGHKLSTRRQNSQATSRPNSMTENPRWVLMPANTGGLGLFTIDSGETLPHDGVSLEIDANKFSRNPGSISVLGLNWTLAFGVTNKLTLLLGFNVYNHVHVGNRSELSFDAGTGPQFDSTVYNELVPGGRPAYVEDYPFAFTNNGGIGPLDIGAKYGFLSGQRGNSMSLALRGDVIIPTKTYYKDLFNAQAQSGALDAQLGVNVSKTVLSGKLMTVGDFGYRFTSNPAPVFRNSPALTRADQIHAGAGFLLFPQRRLQIMNEYTSTIFVGNHTPDTTFGAREPIDGVWGVRAYIARFLAVDLGYRYMLNLGNVHDRNGFIVKVGAAYWPLQVTVLPTITIQLSVEPDSITQGSNQQVTAIAHATDSAGLPMTFTWTADAGVITGTGPAVHWNLGNAKPGVYNINVYADDPRGGTGTDSAQISVQTKPQPVGPPTMVCAADHSTVVSGAKVTITANVQDRSQTSLTYQWQTTGGQILGSGNSIQVDTTGLAPGSYTITGRVQNGKGQTANCTSTITVQAPPPAPKPSTINQCYFARGSARVDNVCKRILDDVALRLQNALKSRVVIIAYATPRAGRPQAASDKLAQARAENVKRYLAQEKGVDPSRIETRTGEGKAGTGRENRKIEIIWVPEGASD